MTQLAGQNNSGILCGDTIIESLGAAHLPNADLGRNR